ncbi:MAG: DUF1189 family protein [Legionellaceae bacterium]|nr:DUF1189 family protein [Legionellaceae bacterium]
MKKLGLDKKQKQPKKKRKIAHYRFLEALYMSFFSRRLYIDVVRRWRGFGLLYLAVMLSVAMLPYVIHVMMAYHQTVEQKLFLPIKKLPPFSMRSGEVQFYSPMPYLVKNSQGEVIALIDTTGKIKQLPYFLYPEASVLITKNALHVRLPTLDLFKQGNVSEAKETVSLFRSNDNTDFFGAEWLPVSRLKQANQLLMLSIYPVLFMFYFGLYIVTLFSFGLFGQFVARLIFKVQLTFKEATRLIAIAATPQAVIYFILFSFDKVYSGTGIIYMVLLAAYFSLGVLAYRRDNRAMVLQ